MVLRTRLNLQLSCGVYLLFWCTSGVHITTLISTGRPGDDLSPNNSLFPHPGEQARMPFYPTVAVFRPAVQKSHIFVKNYIHSQKESKSRTLE